MLALLVTKPPSSSSVKPVGSIWRSDLSGLPISMRRAYGRVQTTSFTCQDASIKRLKPIQMFDSGHRLVDEVQVYALMLTNGNGIQVIVYFTRENRQGLEGFQYRHRPTDKRMIGQKPTGITSVQFIAPDQSTDEMKSHVFRDSFSTRLFLGRVREGRITGSLTTVFPDSRRSFISGAFKARLVGIDKP